MAAVVRICMCSCGRFGVQETDADPACHACGTEDVDWINMDAEDLKIDLEGALELLPGLSEEAEDASESGTV